MAEEGNPGIAGQAEGSPGSVSQAEGNPGTTSQSEPDTPSQEASAVRRAKRQALIEAGANPYGQGLDISDRLADIEGRFAGLEAGAHTDVQVSVAGRIMALRDQGKAVFIVIRDFSGDMQLFIQADKIGESALAAVKDLDVGDWVYAQGNVMRTRRGQISVAPHEVRLVSKSLRPLPEKFHGLADIETRYRQRYVDLIMNPEVRETFEKRFQIVSTLRQVAQERGFIEVETPMLHPVPGGANARPFTTHHNTLDRDLYLRVAPELHLKRLLVGGFERVFEINRCFRNEGMDHTHNPEFTTFEAYQAFSDQNGMMDLTKELIQR
ncbi:MAG: OB-fold nucleic acid binding domain-containing protein, partial [Coriobacteriia bacterium]|nr:OB-fold nucleic acid binding domain-containing protein [Coriobacteriia bacterium]